MLQLCSQRLKARVGLYLMIRVRRLAVTQIVHHTHLKCLSTIALLHCRTLMYVLTV